MGYANLLVHPYTVEIVITPSSLGGYRKLFSPDDGQDTGWYYWQDMFQAYPGPKIAAGLTAGKREYWAFVSTSADHMRVYVDGIELGTTATSFSAPPDAAIFFSDDTATSRAEDIAGVVDAIRLSSATRSADEIAQVNARLNAQP